MKTSAYLQMLCVTLRLFAAAFLVFSPAAVWADERSAVAAPGVPPEYVALQRRLATGWNTWDTNDVLDSVLLPQAISVKIGLKHNSWTNGDEFLAGGDISLRGPDDPHIHVLHHSYDGSYTALEVNWDSHTTRVETAHAGNDLVVLVTPVASSDVSRLPLTVVFSFGFLWDAPGTVRLSGRSAVANSPSGQVRFFAAGEDSRITNVPVSEPYFAADLNGPAGLASGHARSLGEIRALVARARDSYLASLRSFGSKAELADALISAVGWNTIYDPENRRVIVPSSRNWNTSWGGYALFEWDTFLVSPIAAIGSRDLAYADEMEMCREITSEGLVPNYARGRQLKSHGRSEPPVGSLVAMDLYRKFGDRWMLQGVYPYLLRWNRWWASERSLDGYLVWGDDGKPEVTANGAAGTRQGAIYESGLDNSPMYDSANFDEATHRLEMADVGLLSLYLADCKSLAEMADVLGHGADARELRQRARTYEAALAKMWNASAGMYQNKDLVSSKLSPRVSPTNFYPLLAQAVSAERAKSMVTEHLLNPDQFWGTWVIPSISRTDPAFADQNYWRGRIWGPMNYLVARGLDNYRDPEIQKARKMLGERSAALFMREWSERGHVHENYNAVTGQGDDVQNSDAFYTWGALLGLLGLYD